MPLRAPTHLSFFVFQGTFLAKYQPCLSGALSFHEYIYSCRACRSLFNWIFSETGLALWEKRLEQERCSSCLRSAWSNDGSDKKANYCSITHDEASAKCIYKYLVPVMFQTLIERCWQILLPKNIFRILSSLDFYSSSVLSLYSFLLSQKSFYIEWLLEAHLLSLYRGIWESL